VPNVIIAKVLGICHDLHGIKVIGEQAAPRGSEADSGHASASEEFQEGGAARMH
jgi:hypothetical protein